MLLLWYLVISGPWPGLVLRSVRRSTAPCSVPRRRRRCFWIRPSETRTTRGCGGPTRAGARCTRALCPRACVARRVTASTRRCKDAATNHLNHVRSCILGLILKEPSLTASQARFAGPVQSTNHWGCTNGSMMSPEREQTASVMGLSLFPRNNPSSSSFFSTNTRASYLMLPATQSGNVSTG